ncbi:response regulator [candidate division KSB1 bacterium]|nr:response regulator [candidate division KSB1 bacterium]
MQGNRILLVDRQLSYLEVAKKMLKFHNDDYIIDTASTGDECFEKLLSNNYDLILLDYDIDESKGLEVLAKIFRSGFDITVVMLVDENKEDIAFKALERGAADYIMKVRGYLTALPFTVSKVLERQKSGVTPKVTTPSPTESEVIDSDNSKDVQDAYFLLDHQGRFLSSNRLLEKYLEYSEAELLELMFSDLIPQEHEARFNQWLTSIDLGYSNKTLSTSIIGKFGKRKQVEIALKPVRDSESEIRSYKGKLTFKPSSDLTAFKDGTFDQSRMIRDMARIIGNSHNESLSHLLERITQTICQHFQFQRATLALLDRQRKVFVKLIMVGFSSGNENDRKVMEVPQDVIERAFDNSRKVKVLYFNQDKGISRYSLIESLREERRTEPRRPENKWHPRDMVILNLVDRNQETFGYISLDNPLFTLAPDRAIFYNLEIFSSLASLAIETYYRIATTEKRNRRLKQLLITSNIFKLHLNLNEMLNEVVWSIKFSLDFNLVMLGLLSNKSGQMEIKAVACDDKIKALQIGELKYDTIHFKNIFKKQYRRGKSYYINQQEPLLKELKDIYYSHRRFNADGENYWSWYSMLVIPIRRREDKIVGFLMVDDPADTMIPTRETLHTLEILATQISIAIDNRLTYLQSKEKIITDKTKFLMDTEEKDKTFKKLVDKVFH